MTTGRKPLSELLRDYRISAALTIEMLAERSGISDRTISNIERGASRSPQRHTLQALADALALDEAEARALLQASAGRRRQAIAADQAVSIAPTRVPDFTGRTQELDTIVDRLRQAPAERSNIVVLSGAPGIGKTTTAVEALHRAGSGETTTVFVDMAGLAVAPLTPLQALQSLLQQTQDDLTPVPRSLDQAANLWKRVSSSRPILILLDNAANEEQLRPVLASSGHCPVIVTSRRTLTALEGVLRVTLQPLSLGEGQELLGRIIPASQRAEGDLEVLATLCADVPLALRIAGNRVASRPAWTAGDFIDRMREEEKRLRTLTAGDLGVAAAFQSSYGNLREELKDLYRSLPLIDGSTFDARIAASLIPGDLLDTEDMLDELTDLGLLEARGSTRYRLHDLAKLYAAERQQHESGDSLTRERKTRLRHWLLLTASRAGQWFEPNPASTMQVGPGLEFIDADSARAWLHTEVDSWFPAYRQAASLGEHEWVLMVADSLHWFSDLWSAWGHWHEVFAASAAAAAATENDVAQAVHLGYLAWADIIEKADPVAAVRDATAARDAADRSADSAQIGWSRFYLAWAFDKRGELGAAIQEAEDSLTALQLCGDEEGILQAAALAAHLYHRLGGTDQAIAAHHTLLRRIDDTAEQMQPTIAQFTKTSVERLLAEEYLTAGNWDESAAFARSSLESAKDIEYPTGGFMSLLTLARALAMGGDPRGARQAYADAEAVAELTLLANVEAQLSETFHAIEEAERYRGEHIPGADDEAHSHYAK